MFELKCPEKCASCEHLDLEITNLYAGDQIVERVIRCSNEDLCEYFERRLREELRKEEARRETILQNLYV